VGFGPVGLFSSSAGSVVNCRAAAKGSSSTFFLGACFMEAAIFSFANLQPVEFSGITFYPHAKMRAVHELYNEL
jgi:hypothetical protein